MNGHFEAMMGRPLTKAGAHTTQQQMNRKAIGVCLVGNFDVEPPPEGMLLYAVRVVVAPLMQVFQIPLANLHPHRKFATYKSCPGTAFPWETFVQMVKERIATDPVIGPESREG